MPSSTAPLSTAVADLYGPEMERSDEPRVSRAVFSGLTEIRAYLANTEGSS